MTPERKREVTQELESAGFQVIENSLNNNKLEMLDAIKNLPPEENFVPIPGMFIPLSSEVILLPVQQDSYKAGATENNTKLILPTTAIKNMLGVVYAFGPDCRKPLALGMKVLFDPKGIYLDVIAPDGRLYIFLLEHNVYAAVPKENYVLPMKGMIKDKIEIRNDERREGMKAASERDVNEMQESNEKRNHKSKTTSYDKSK